MDFFEKQIAPPNSWEKFETLCLALFSALWHDATAQKHGRQGQRQTGVDIFGHNREFGNGLYGVQCKLYLSTPKAKKIITQFDTELIKVEGFNPPLAHWIFATTASNDAVVQSYVLTVSETRAAQGKCTVEIMGWETIVKLLTMHREIAQHFYPEHFSNFFAKKLPQLFHLPATRLSDFFSDPLNHLSRIRDFLEVKRNNFVLTAVAIHGMGGVGKTQLALKYSHLYRRNYSGVWWFHAETESAIEQDCILFCHKQGIALAPNEPAGHAMVTWLDSQPSWLLVYDNAEDSKLIRTYLPFSGDHHILITSRIPNWLGMQNLALGVWCSDQALVFLRKRLNDENDEHMSALVTALDGLPLALEQACAYINKNIITITDYITRVTKPSDATRLLGINESEYGARSVLATLSVAFEKLSLPAQSLLNLCGWLAATPIPEFSFTENVEHLPPTLQSMIPDLLTWRETIAELHNYGLCQVGSNILIDHAGNHGAKVFCLSFHRLTQAAIRVRSSGKLTLLLLWAGFPSNADESVHWPRCRVLMPHVQQMQRFYQKDWDNTGLYPALLARLASYLKYGPAQYSQALDLEQRALLMEKEMLGEEHPSTLITTNNLAFTLRLMGELHASYELHEKVLVISQRMFGEEHLETADCLNNLALTLCEMGDSVRAGLLHQKTLAIRLKVLGMAHRSTLNSMNNLALTLVKMGNFEEAKIMHEKELDICRGSLGPTHPDTLTSMSNLAYVLWHMGALLDAKNLFEQTALLREQVLGVEHPDTLTTINGLGMVLGDLNEFSLARTCHEVTLERRSRILGENHPDTLRSINNLALIIMKMGQFSAAKALFEKDLVYCRQVLGEDHPDTLTALSNLAEALRQMGDFTNASKFHEKVVAKRMKFLGVDHPKTILAMHRLEQVLIKINESSEFK